MPNLRPQQEALIDIANENPGNTIADINGSKAYLNLDGKLVPLFGSILPINPYGSYTNGDRRGAIVFTTTPHTERPADRTIERDGGLHAVLLRGARESEVEDFLNGRDLPRGVAVSEALSLLEEEERTTESLILREAGVTVAYPNVL